MLIVSYLILSCAVIKAFYDAHLYDTRGHWRTISEKSIVQRANYLEAGILAEYLNNKEI